MAAPGGWSSSEQVLNMSLVLIKDMSLARGVLKQTSVIGFQAWLLDVSSRRGQGVPVQAGRARVKEAEPGPGDPYVASAHASWAMVTWDPPCGLTDTDD